MLKNKLNAYRKEYGVIKEAKVIPSSADTEPATDGEVQEYLSFLTVQNIKAVEGHLKIIRNVLLWAAEIAALNIAIAWAVLFFVAISGNEANGLLAVVSIVEAIEFGWLTYKARKAKINVI